MLKRTILSQLSATFDAHKLDAKRSQGKQNIEQIIAEKLLISFEIKSLTRVENFDYYFTLKHETFVERRLGKEFRRTQRN